MWNTRSYVYAFGAITFCTLIIALFYITETDQMHERVRGPLLINRTLQGYGRLNGDLRFERRHNPPNTDEEKDRTSAERQVLESVLKFREEPPVAKEKTLQDLRKFYHGKNSSTVKLEIPENRQDFKTVSGLDSLLYIHAALWQSDNVRISAIKKAGKLDNILCVFWYSSDQRSNFTIVKALVKDLQGYHFQNTFAYIKCFLKGDKGKEKLKAPLYVGLVNEKTLSAGHRILLSVQNRDMDPDKVNKMANTGTGNGSNKGFTQKPAKNRVVEFTVCIPALFNYNNAAQLVEKLEMVRLLGAGRVVLYDSSIGPNVRSVLRLYTQEWASGNETMEVVVLSWKLPTLVLHYRGQVGAVDDCLYRFGWLSQYMVFDDLDELIVPLRHENWSKLIAEREELSPGYAAFMFRCSVMNMDHSSPADGFESEARSYESTVLGVTQRDDYFYPPVKRSKLILNPRKIESIGVHHVYEGYGPTDVIPVDQGILYHYRWPIIPCGPEVKDNRVFTKFGKRLLARLKLVWSKLKGVPLSRKPLISNSTRQTCNKGVM